MGESIALLRRALSSFLGHTFMKRPIQAVYYLTYRCYSRCLYCDIWKRGGPVADPDDVARNVAALKDMGVRFISFTGGEPLLYPHLARVLESAKKNGMRTTMITSGLSYSEKAHEIKGLVDDLAFSLSTTDRDAYLRERCVDGLQEVTGAIELAVALGEPVSILATIWEENILELPGLLEFAECLGVMCILGPVYRYFGNKAFPSQRADILRALSHNPGVWMNRAFLEFMAQGGNRVERPRCGALKTTLAISPSGCLLVPCFHRAIEAWPINEDLPGLYRSRRFDKARKKVGRWPFCKGCHIFCYFEGEFLRRPDRLCLLDASSRIRWLLMKSKFEQTRG
jgi:MoaA/NifB/PqqE/SkfB family radical SAM enzyme